MEFVKSLALDSKVKVSGIDIDGQSRGKTLLKQKFTSTLVSGFGFCNVIFQWDLHDKLYSSDPNTCYSDIIAVPDLNTFRRIPWDNNTPFFLLDFIDPISLLPFYACPRGLLKAAIAKCNTFNCVPYCGIEFEFYNFKETPASIHKSNGVNLNPITNGMFGYSITRPSLEQDYFNQIFSQCLEFGIPIEGFHTETGPGVYEAALEYSDALQMADRAHLFKTSVKQIGLAHNILPCFMAKPHADLPGCSGHIHLSLCDLNGLNLFSNTTSGNICDQMKWFISGILKGLPSIMCILAPTINSYKRLVENFWAPVNISYGFDDRNSAIRIIAPPTCPPKSTRIEIRVPGADINSHLALAALISCGIYGIENKLETDIPIKDCNYAYERLPKTLREAATAMDAENSLARTVLGDQFVNHYVMTRLHECKLWDEAVTNWEMTRYIETV